MSWHLDSGCAKEIVARDIDQLQTSGPGAGDEKTTRIVKKSANAGPPPSWDGSTPFEDYLIRDRLWVSANQIQGPCSRTPVAQGLE